MRLPIRARGPVAVVIRVLVSSSAAERLEAARAFLAGLPAGAGALIVGASRGAADDLAREATRDAGATFGLHRASLLQLAAGLAAAGLARRGLAPSSVLGGEALAARVTFEAAAAGALGYFEPVSRFPGFARAVASTVGELRLARVAPGALAGPDGGAAHDVGELLRRFEGELHSGGLADRRTVFDLAADALADDPPPPIARLPLVLLDVAVHSRAEEMLVRGLLAASGRALVTVPEGDQRTLGALSGIAGAPVAAAPAPDAGSALSYLRTYLFSDDAPAVAAHAGEAVFFSAPGEGREAVEIVRRVLEEARRGTRFDRMAILLRSPQLYSSLLETALGRAGVPAFFTGGARRPDPAGRAFLALLDCALEKLSARRFAEYLSLGQVPPLAADGAPAPRGDVWVAADEESLTLGSEATALAARARPRRRRRRTRRAGSRTRAPSSPARSARRGGGSASWWTRR